MPRHQKIAELADLLVSQALVEAARSLVERRHAEKYVLVIPPDALLGKGHQSGAITQTAKLRCKADGLYVAGKGALQIEQQETGELCVDLGDISLATRQAHGA